MSLRDRLRARGSDATQIKTAEYDGVPADSLSGEVDVTEFEPRPDGDYRCVERGLILRFARPAVTETDAVAPESARGEFTTAGRFVVQRPFGRPVVYTALTANSLAADDAVLTVRRTDTATGATERLDFRFEPDRR